MKTFLSFFLFISVNICLLAQESDDKTIHIMVALCDNQYQGIVKVPKGIGNGQDPNSNLYWGVVATGCVLFSVKVPIGRKSANIK